MVFSDGKRSWVVRRGFAGKRMIRAEPVDLESARRREARLAR